MTTLTTTQNDWLDVLNWTDRVDDKQGIVVSICDQQLLLIERKQIVRSYSCSTGKSGIGNQNGSGRTPDGWHQVGAKIGDSLPVGAILKGRQWTDQVWHGMETDEDLILTRILRLSGLEPGRNQGGEVDTWDRLIYIHGTNAPSKLGQPVSHGGEEGVSPRHLTDLSGVVGRPRLMPHSIAPNASPIHPSPSGPPVMRSIIFSKHLPPRGNRGGTPRLG